MSCKNAEDCSVLMAEDDQLLMLLMGMQLEVDGVKFCSAASGYQFLELLKSHHATLLILDIAMPGLSGFDIVDRIKSESQLELYRTANLIIHTSQDLTIADQHRLSLGNTVFFTKTSCDNLARVVDCNASW